MKIQLILFAFTLGLFSCSETTKKEEKKESKTEEKQENYREIGDQVTNISQKTLLNHVGRAMKMGGPIAAIQYCNINAMALTDSLSKANKVTISRVTDRNRNPNNTLSDKDLPIWNHYKTGAINVMMGDTLINIAGKNIYYKPIYTGNPTCLTCHGMSGTDIMDLTIAKLDEYYPNDKARDYNLGELRGMWKVEFQ